MILFLEFQLPQFVEQFLQIFVGFIGSVLLILHILTMHSLLQSLKFPPVWPYPPQWLPLDTPSLSVCAPFSLSLDHMFSKQSCLYAK